jgi:hypothetical protein
MLFYAIYVEIFTLKCHKCRELLKNFMYIFKFHVSYKFEENTCVQYVK